MAKLARRTSTPAPRRSSSNSPKLAKLQARLAAASKRGSAAASRNESLLFSVGAAAALAMAEKRGINLPSPMGLDPYLVIGGLLYIGGAKLASGKNGRRLEAAGEGILAAAAARSVKRGGVKVAGDDSYVEDDSDIYIDGESDPAMYTPG